MVSRRPIINVLSMLVRTTCAVGVLFALAGCASTDPAQTSGTPAACVMPSEPEIVLHDGATILARWEFAATAFDGLNTLPSEPAYAAYRAAVDTTARRPVHDPVKIDNAEMRARWERESHNIDVAFSGTGGRVEPIGCLDALVFAYQAARFDQLKQPTEYIASILVRDGRLRIWFGASNTMFPPKQVYTIDQAAADVADGWRYVAMVHNHTLVTYRGSWALGVPAPSVADVRFARSLIKRLALESIRVTNGVYTLEVKAAELEGYLGPP